jgi:hypothetical protein
MREELEPARGAMVAAIAHMLGSIAFAMILWSQLYGSFQSAMA